MENRYNIVLQIQHTPKTLTDEETNYLAKLSNVKYTEEILDNILIPRVVGTPNHEKVVRYIVGELQKFNWHVEIDEFKDKTPNFGELTFKNIVASLNPNAERYLVLACHYDSKYFANEEFVGKCLCGVKSFFDQLHKASSRLTANLSVADLQPIRN